MTDYNHQPVVPRTGLAANLAAATAYPNEFLWTTDTQRLYVEQGGSKICIGGTGAYTASMIEIPNGVGTPTYDDLQDYLNLCQASGRLTGGVLTAHAGPDGTLDISEMEGMIHTANTLGSPLIYFKKAAYSGLALTDNAVNYIWITYSGGTLTYTANAARPTEDYNVFVVGRCWRSGNTVEAVTTGQNIYNMYGRQQDRLLTKYGTMDRATGGVIYAHATALRLAVDAGVWYFGNTRLDTSAADTFEVWYKTGGGSWTLSGSKTLFSEVFDGGTSKVYETYQNGTSLAALGANKYGVYWIFMCPEGDLYVLLGTSSYNNIGEAQAASTPASLPPYLVNWGRLIGRVICQKTGAAFYSVESSFSTAFTLSAAVDHGSLSGLADDDHTQYVLKATLTATGDLYYASAIATPAALAIGTADKVLVTNGTIPSWSGYLLSGTTGGKTNFAVTNGKTLTLTATDNYGLTVEGASAINQDLTTDADALLGSLKLASLGTGGAFLQLGPDTPSANGTGRIKFLNSSTLKNWCISFNDTISGVLEFIPSTAAGGGTFSTNVFQITSAGAATFSSTIQATTAKLTDLTDGYIPYHVSDASGLANSVIFQSGSNVGIGTTGPGAKLHVYGSGGNQAIYLEASDTSDDWILFKSGGMTLGGICGGWATDTGYIRFDTKVAGGGTTEKMRISSGGNVGIGTTSPQNLLHVHKSDPGDVFIQIQNPGGGSGGGSGLKAVSNATSAIFGAGASAATLQAQSAALMVGGSDSTHTLIGSQNANGYINFAIGDLNTAASEKMRVTSGGNVGIGTTVPGYPLDVVGTTGIRTYITSSSGKGVLTLGRTDLNNSGTELHMEGSNSQTNWRISTNSVVAGAFEITPSTAGGGTTYTTPAVTILNNGNVGIGTTSPTYKLSVEGSSGTYIGVKDTSAHAALRVDGATEGGIVLIDQGATSGRRAFNWISDAGNMRVRLMDDAGTGIATDNMMVVRYDGNIGIGTNVPASLLEIQGGTTTTGAILTLGSKETHTVAGDVLGRINFYTPLDSAGGDANLVAASIAAVAQGTFSATSNSTALYFCTGNSETATIKMYLSTIALGSYVPLAINDCDGSAITVATASTNGVNAIFSTNEGGATGKVGIEGSAAGTEYTGSLAYSTYLMAHSNHPLQLCTNHAARVTIDNAGLVGIGSTAPAVALDVVGQISASTAVHTTTLLSDHIGEHTGSHGVAIDNAVAVTGAITATDNITAYYSDMRLKTKVGPITNALDKVTKLEGFYYTGNETAGKYGFNTDKIEVGVSTQDLESILPEVVHPAPFDIHNQSGENYKTAQYERIVPLLIEAIKELKRELEALKSDPSR